MRKILFTLLAIMATIAVNAGRVSKQEALQKAQQFMPNKQFEEAKAFARSDQSSESEPFYIFNVGNKGGYVIVSGDDRIVDIIGYSDYGELDIDKAPTNLKWLLECYQQLINSLAQNPDVKAKAKTRGSSSSRVAIEPLITTHWGQAAPYNNMCPKIGDQRCLTGCVATAMAQIINYHKWPKGQTSTVGAYTTKTSGISMPQLEPTSFDWDNMTDDDIARLMLYCGQSVQMDFGLTQSGANYSPIEYFKNIFGYSKQICSYLGMLFSTDHLEELVYKELAENRPVFYTGTNSSVGHAFVVDGYQDGMFHINWGWDGDQDGYFILTGLTEDVMPFPLSYNTEVFLGIQAPASDISQSAPIVTRCSAVNRSVYRKNVSDDFIFEVSFDSDLLSDINDVTYFLGYGLYDEKGLVKVFAQQKKTFPMEESFSESFIWGSDIPVGTYRIMPVYRHSESEEWKKAAGTNLWQVTAHVSEKSLYFKSAIEEYDGNYEEYGAHDINGVTYKLSKEFEKYWAYVLPYQLTGKYSGSVTIPNTVDYEGNQYLVREDLFNPFENCDNLTSLSVAAEWRITSISNCNNLAEIDIKQGNTICISNCPLLEKLEFPVTMNTPLIENCSHLKTFIIKCKALKFNWIGLTWSEGSLPELADVYFPSMIPPVVSGEGDVSTNSHATLHVPKGSLTAYKNSQWKLWNIIDDTPVENVTFGYCHSETVSNDGMATGTVCGDNNEELAMRIPAKELTPYIGCQITNIQVYSPERSINDWGYESYEYAFITKRGTDYLVKQPFEVLRGAWNTIELEDPYTITGEDLFVGIGRHGQLGIRYEDDTFVADALWRRIIGDDDSKDDILKNMELERGKWDYVKSCCKKEKGPSALFAHPWPIKFAIEGESVPQGVVIRELDLGEEGNAVTARTRAAGSGVQIKGAIRNRSQEIVKSYTVEWSIDGGEKQSKSFETLLYPNESETITIDLPTTLQSGNHTVSTNVTLVNNVKNGLEGCNMPTIELNDGNVSLDSLLGDVNCDSEVNEADVREVVNFIMGIPSDFFFKEVADMNEDDEVNAADVVLIVDKMPIQQ